MVPTLSKWLCATWSGLAAGGAGAGACFPGARGALLARLRQQGRERLKELLGVLLLLALLPGRASVVAADRLRPLRRVWGCPLGVSALAATFK